MALETLKQAFTHGFRRIEGGLRGVTKVGWCEDDPVVAGMWNAVGGGDSDGPYVSVDGCRFIVLSLSGNETNRQTLGRTCVHFRCHWSKFLLQFLLW